MNPKKITFNTLYSIKSLYADVDREVLTKILSNLFSNALKHSHTVIELGLRCNEKYFEIKIENDGDVIPDEYVEKYLNLYLN